MKRLSPIASYAALFLFEVGYILFAYDPASKRTQAGLMLIFACEVAFAVRVSKVQLQLKRTDRRGLRISRVYAAGYAGGLLAAIAVTLSSAFAGERIVLVTAFGVAGVSKMLWERSFGNELGHIAAADARTN